MDLFGGSITLGRFLGVNVRVHYLFLLLVAFRLFSDTAHWQWTLTWSAMLFMIILCHEYGHCFGARAVGGYANDILMWPLGGLAFAHAPMTPWAQFVTVAAGPLVNVVFCAVSAGILIAITGEPRIVTLNPLADSPALFLFRGWERYVALFYDVNLFILAFNLLPIFPMDGGQLFRAALWPMVGLRRATIAACYVGLAGAIGFGVWGLTRGSGGMMLMLLALFGATTCWQQLQAARAGYISEDVAPHLQSRSRVRARGPSLGRILTGEPSRPATRVEHNPNPGGWESRQEEQQREQAEIDRILKKISEHGIHSLSYVERQTLENTSRKRRAADEQFDRETRL